MDSKHFAKYNVGAKKNFANLGKQLEQFRILAKAFFKFREHPTGISTAPPPHTVSCGLNYDGMETGSSLHLPLQHAHI